MKEIKNLIKHLKARVIISLIGELLLIFFLFGAGIVNLIYLPQIWWLSLIFWGLTIMGILCFVWLARFMIKRVKAMEIELAEAERQEVFNKNHIDK